MNGTAEPKTVPMSGPVSVPVKEAATLLGIGERAVRKRIATGSLQAERVSGAWFVRLDRAEPRHGTSGSSSANGNRNHSTGAPVPKASDQLQLVMQEWVAPLVDRIAGLERELGREQVRRETAELRLTEVTGMTDELRRRAEEAEVAAQILATQLAAAQAATSPAEPLPPPRRRSWWARLVGA